MAERIWVLVAVALFSALALAAARAPDAGARRELALLAAAGSRRRPSSAGAGTAPAGASLATVVATLIAIWRAFGYLPWDRGHQVYPVRIVSGLHDGAKNWFETLDAV